jgi:hypothetical protein
MLGEIGCFVSLTVFIKACRMPAEQKSEVMAAIFFFSDASLRPWLPHLPLLLLLNL